MAIREYKLPNGTLYVNTSKNMIEHIFDNLRPIKILPGKAYLAGDMKGLPLEEYFASPEIWDAKWQVYQSIQKTGRTVVVIDAERVDKFGDQLLLTVLPKAYKETWGDKAKVDIVAPKKFHSVWENNPHIRSISTKVNPDRVYDKVLDVTTLGLKFRRKADGNCADMIVNGLGLTLINKTPVLVITEEEKEWAQKQIKKLSNKDDHLCGISLYSAVKSRTYPKMMQVANDLKGKGYNIVLLDEKDRDGRFKYTFRQSAALINEMDIVVTTDSALLHIAGALKKRIVGLFAYTEGSVFTESYEKAYVIQAPCPYGKKPCWWQMDCIKGPRPHLDRTNLEHAHCLKELNIDVVVKAVEKQMVVPKNLLLVVLTYNALAMTKRAINSIRSFHNYDLFVVDNESTDGTPKWLRQNRIEFVSLRTSVAGAQNAGIKKFKEGNYDYIVFLNNDIVMRYDCLDELVHCAEVSKAYGVMSTQIDGASWKIDSVFPSNRKWEVIRDLPAGSYSCTLFTKECIEVVGTFNGRYKPRYIEDNDHALRIRALGGKFVKSSGALFWHYLGAVIKTVEKAKGASHTKYWWNNIEIFTEMWGFSPHVPQHLNKLGLEWRKIDLVKQINELYEKRGRGIKLIVSRNMGGYGDILFITIVAKAVRNLFKPGIVEIIYRVPTKFISLLKNNPNIDQVLPIDESVLDILPNIHINLKDVEFRAELQEMQKFGEIRSARTEIYLNVLGLDKYQQESDYLKPDYFVTKSEKIIGESAWLKNKKKRIVIVQKGSNKLKHWPHCKVLIQKLKDDDSYNILVLDKDDGEYKYSFRKAASIVNAADLVISPDSGISNLAGTLGIPVITIFSNRNGGNFAKMFKSMVPVQGFCPFKKRDYCDFFCPCFGEGPHRKKENKSIPQCLTKLSHDMVYDIVKEVLK